MKGSSDKRSLIDFFRGKLRLYQAKGCKVSVDKVIFLSKIKGVKKHSRVIELGAGTGFLSLSVAKRFGTQVVALELDSEAYRLLEENVKLNSLEDKVNPILANVKEVRNIFPRGAFDVVITNPPFYRREFAAPGERPDPAEVELFGSLEDFLSAASYLLKDSGYLNLLFPSFRLQELFIKLSNYNLAPSDLWILYPTPKKGGKLSVVVARRNLKPDLRVHPAVILNSEDGTYMPDVAELLEGWL